MKKCNSNCEHFIESKKYRIEKEYGWNGNNYFVAKEEKVFDHTDYFCNHPKNKTKKTKKRPSLNKKVGFLKPCNQEKL